MDLDRGGNYTRRADVDDGPSIGHVWSQMGPQRSITSGGTTTLDVQTGVALVNFNGVVALALPSVLSWLLQPSQPFGGAIWIKDIGGFASPAQPITVVPNGTELIDTSANYKIVNPFALIRLYPLNDLTGWFVG